MGAESAAKGELMAHKLEFDGCTLLVDERDVLSGDAWGLRTPLADGSTLYSIVDGDHLISLQVQVHPDGTHDILSLERRPLTSQQTGSG
jgi:hypothetical protein